MQSTPNDITRRLIVTGRVQGVGFRAFVHHHAQKLGLNGFVRNRTDGTVEIVAAGDTEKIETLITLCHGGPPVSHVEKVEVTEAEKTQENGFRHLPTI